MINYPEIDPVAVAFGPVSIHWYGLTYLIGIASAWWLARLRSRMPGSIVPPEQIDDLVFYGALGVVIGGRVGSVLFYNFDSFVDNPLYLFKIWQGGMSFHGGFLGVLVAMEWYRRKLGCSFFQLTDFIAPFIPLGLAAGRIGNFINAELWGAPGNVPWAMKLSCERFPPDRYIDFAGPLCLSPRHPTQLYEMLLEGFLLFCYLVGDIFETKTGNDRFGLFPVAVRADQVGGRVYSIAGCAYWLPDEYRLAYPRHCIIGTDDTIWYRIYYLCTKEKSQCNSILN